MAEAPYDIGNPTLSEIYVSPGGNDANDGATSSTPLRTIMSAWAKIPSGAALDHTGFRINLLPGTYFCEPEEPDNCQNYRANLHGTFLYPIILRALNGPGTATVRGGFDFARMSYFYILDLTLSGGTPLPLNNSGNNLLHLADVDHVLLRNVVLDGPDCANDSCTNLQEVLKINQAQYIYIENCDIGGAWHTCIDYFSVQYSHVINSRVHTAGQWCMYAKGGSAYLQIEGNEFHHAQLGFGAGQSANFAVMRPPWIHYDVYDVKFVNNVVHDIEGTGLSARGAYNALFAYNTFVNVGVSTNVGYPLIEVIPAERGCSPTDEIQNPALVCQGLINQGGWGPNFLTDNFFAIPNKNVLIYNNIFDNRAPAQTQYSHFYVAGPIPRPVGFFNLPSTIASDDNLVFAGNIIWNGPQDHPIGIDENSGCLDSNPSCNEAQILAANRINVIEPQFANYAGGDYRPAPAGNIAQTAAREIPAFTWTSFTPSVPAGNVSNAVLLDRNGWPRPALGPPGAYLPAPPLAGSGLMVR